MTAYEVGVDRECPDCTGVAEPEYDDSLDYWACGACGYEFGFQRRTVAQEGECALGVPEEIRRAVGNEPRPLPLLQIGKRPGGVSGDSRPPK